MAEITIRSLRDKQKEKLQQTEDFLHKKAELDVISPAEKRKKKNIAKMVAKFLIFTMFVFLIGGLGGIWWDRLVLPNLLVEYPQLNQYGFLKQVNERTTIVRETENVKISEEQAISDVIEKTRPTTVDVMAKNASGQFDKIGSGIILTSDGYIITPLKNIYANAAAQNKQVVNKEIQVKLTSGRTYDAKVIAQNSDYSQAILKIDENNLPVIPYANYDGLKLGQRLVILDDAISTDIISRLITDYKMPGSTNSSLQKRIQIVQSLNDNSAGVAIINLEGQLIGVEQGANIVIPISEVKEFIDKSVTKG